MKANILFVLLCMVLMSNAEVSVQDIKVPAPASLDYPRFLAGNTDRNAFQKRIIAEEWAKNTYEQSKRSVDEYVNRHQTDSTWIVSRLMMFWKTRSAKIFIRGGTYDHAEGEAPVPTVKFPGMRGGVSTYTAPKLENIMPYMDDPRGLYLLNKLNNQMEWVDIAKTGTIIEGINNNIMRMGYTSSALYWLSGEEKYARFAFDLFDTYMTGMYYRSEPYDLLQGHHQTLAGLSSFEVIQEVAIITSLTGIYDFLYSYLQQKAPQKMKVYSDVFRKWADLQIAHGVAFNNWNLMQAKNVLNIALLLDEDKKYPDGKGNRYYTNCILNTNSQRQWSLQKVVNEGFDPVTGMWNESAAYSFVVLNDIMGMVGFFDRYYGLDLVERMPVLKTAVTAIAQYLFPNGYYTSFGDSHYGRINLSAAYQMLANAQKNNKPQQANEFTAFIKTIRDYYKESGFGVEAGEAGKTNNINALLFNNETSALNDTIKPGAIHDYITPVFSSPHVSLFIQRNGLDAKNGLMAAMSGSEGNHMHAGGISMELYGKGYMLGPESGIGTNYFQADYAEYYSQFPAHNTVVVDGISAYPVMKSNHAFEMKSCYPSSGVPKDYFRKASFGNLYFLEPETQSDQMRLTGIIRTSDSTGYYVDLFRSRRKDGKDKMHDYIYHNMGQQVLVSDKDGNALSLQPTEKLSFGGGHLFAYDYFSDKRSVSTDKDINATFKLSVPGKEEVQMNMWMKGEKDREIFSVKSPKSKAIDRMGLAAEIVELPLPAIITRQSGEAWRKPFVAVFEPSSASQPRSIVSILSFGPSSSSAGFVGLEIDNKTGSRQFIFSADSMGKAALHKNKSFLGSYAVISELGDKLEYIFLGNGTKIQSGNYSIIARKSNTVAILSNEKDGWYITATQPIVLRVPRECVNGKMVLRLKGKERMITVTGKQVIEKGAVLFAFELPAVSWQKLQ